MLADTQIDSLLIGAYSTNHWQTNLLSVNSQSGQLMDKTISWLGDLQTCYFT